ncbi:hypothetical protein I5M27_07755 [Adhaeribacter sp. BT258]|uniref:TonB dependent receptor n=1 Tax=Adhaeribacter terrigena TaxID=2793070 RepID=A0ABS1C128_9BACT|nr:hypothetical protein [Adhaeribacter terrigena]MBK0402877.1 hypothetical protein [Adhaeribacter terrigena]
MRNTFKITGIAMLLAFGPVAGFQAFAQKGWNNDGRLESTEIVVEKNRVIELPEASRNYEKFRIEPPEKKTNKVTYRFNDYKLADQDVNLSVRVLTIRQEDLPKLYGNYVKAGFGNYSTPYLKGYFHNKRDDKASFGGNISHVSSNGPVKDSDVSNTEIGAHGESYLGNFTIGGRANYERDGYNFYGYNRNLVPEGQTRLDEQSFNRIGAEAYLNNLLEASSKMQYKLGGGVKYFSDDYDASEFDGFANLNLDYYLGKTSRVNLFTDFSYISYNDAGKVSRPFFRIRPSYQMDLDKLDISVGAMLAYADDKVESGDKLNFYPAIRVGFEAIENKLILFGGLGGDLQRVTVNSLTRENPWLSSSFNGLAEIQRPGLDVRNTDKQIEVYGGITGSLASNVQFTARASYQNLKNLYFFNHSVMDSSRFVLQYDDEATSLLNLYGEVIYNRADKTRFGVKMDYNNYGGLNLLEQPFYRPSLMTSVFGSYNLYKKILFNAELYYIGSSFGKIQRGLGSAAILESDNIVDLNLKVDYRISEKFSTFVMLNNVLGKKYERFVYYPTKGFNVIGGITYTF